MMHVTYLISQELPVLGACFVCCWIGLAHENKVHILYLAIICCSPQRIKLAKAPKVVW